MINHSFFYSRLTSKELVWGWRYLLFQAVFLPSLLTLFNSILPSPLSAAALNFLFFSINLGAAILIFHRYLGQFFRPDGKKLLCIFAIAAILFAVCQGCSFGIGKLFSSVFDEFSNINDQSIAAMTKENYALMFLCTVCFVPIIEECFYRGLIFRGLYERSPLAAWLVSVILFSFIHIMNYIGSYPAATLFLCFLQYVPAGICLAAAYRLSGSLLSPILIHAAVNAVGMLSLR